MEDVDFARAWLAFKAYIANKPSHGRDALMSEMGRLEVDGSPTGKAALARARSQSDRTTPGRTRDRAVEMSGRSTH